MRKFLACLGGWWLAVVALLVPMTACARQNALFDGEQAYEHVLAQCQLGPRPVGSDAGWETAEYILGELGQFGWSVETQEFTYRGITGRNVIGKRGKGSLVMLGAHYDTRSLADCDPDHPTLPVLGANDGASGVAVLLELARTLDVDKTGVEVWLVFFDAEDQGGIDGWPFCVGASHMAQHLSVRPQAVVVVDMVGDRDQDIYWEGNSDPSLMAELWHIAADLGYEEHLIPEYRHTMMDDHVPFGQLGLTAVDIIDFDYRYWHTTEDTPDKVSPASLHRVGRVLETWLEDRL